MVHLMVDPLETLGRGIQREVVFYSEELTLESALSDLLYELLQKVIFYKDAEGLFLRVDHLSISPQKGASGFELRVMFSGEPIQPNPHLLGTDVKGVTFHKYDVSRRPSGWKATVVVDT
jgi:SHS2 domain-containing protein